MPLIQGELCTGVNAPNKIPAIAGDLGTCGTVVSPALSWGTAWHLRLLVAFAPQGVAL